ncbi:MAG: SAM-dependent methyltransferase [Pseudomonadota bacterium]
MTNSPSKAPIGTLWMAATTLGDIKDIPLRSLELLKECPFLVFEEDKQARQFLKAAGVQRQWMRYTEQREAFTLEELEKELLAGNDALYMSDQGTPGLADPGRDLVEVALRVGAKLRCVPGPSSLTATISVCPIDCRRFQFAGFAPRDEQDREDFLRQHLDHPWPIVLFDTPYRMRQFFETLAKVLHGSDRKIFVGVDISGEHEDFWWDTADGVFKRVTELPEKRNYVVIVEGNGGDFPAKKPFPGKRPQNQNRPNSNRPTGNQKKSPPARRR